MPSIALASPAVLLEPRLDGQCHGSPGLDLEKYCLSEAEQLRIADLMRLTGEGHTALDVGALWGYNSELLSHRYQWVTALDLNRPQWSLPRVTTVAGNATGMQFPDNSFDCVLCAEVLEHIPDVAKAASELARVTRDRLVIGVPLEQDIRLGRVTCIRCGQANPPYGHVNSFTEESLKALFPGMKVEETSFVMPIRRERTSSPAAWLMDLAGNPDGDYQRLEPCMYCGRKVYLPRQTFAGKACAYIARRMNTLQNLYASVRPGWIHLVLRKDSTFDPR